MKQKQIEFLKVVIRKNYLTIMVLALLCAVLSACGDKAGTVPDDRLLGDFGSEYYDLISDMDELQKKYDEAGAKKYEILDKLCSDPVIGYKQFLEIRGKIAERKFNSAKDDLAEMESKRIKLCSEAVGELADRPLNATTKENMPFKVAEPFKVTKVTDGLGVTCEGVIEMTNLCLYDDNAWYVPMPKFEVSMTNGQDSIIVESRCSSEILTDSANSSFLPKGTKIKLSFRLVEIPSRTKELVKRNRSILQIDSLFVGGDFDDYDIEDTAEAKPFKPGNGEFVMGAS